MDRPNPPAASGIAFERSVFDEIRDRDPVVSVEVMKSRRDARLRGDAHRKILVGIAQRAFGTLYSQYIAPTAGLDQKDKCPGNAARQRPDGGAERRPLTRP